MRSDKIPARISLQVAELQSRICSYESHLDHFNYLVKSRGYVLSKNDIQEISYANWIIADMERQINLLLYAKGKRY